MSDSNIQRTLGRIEAQLGLILEEQKRARHERKEINSQQEIIRRKQVEAEKERAAMAVQLETVKKNTDEFNKWKERGVGALMLISLAAAIVGGTFAASWQKIMDMFR